MVIYYLYSGHADQATNIFGMFEHFNTKGEKHGSCE